ncbi:MAG: PHP domain-containing protein [Chloroflexi bacterium]|nr:PHP domain-containing protein [Chloroflexota bacterium]
MQRQQGGVDLHIHTTASDGSLRPAEVVQLALKLRLAAIALADHDTLAGFAEARAAAEGTGLKIVPGVEISSDWPVGDFHILGLYVDPWDGPLNESLAAMRVAWLHRARKVLEKLAALGMPLDWEEVAAFANGGSAIGRMHVARAMVRRGYGVCFHHPGSLPSLHWSVWASICTPSADDTGGGDRADPPGRGHRSAGPSGGLRPDRTYPNPGLAGASGSRGLLPQSFPGRCQKAAAAGPPVSPAGHRRERFSRLRSRRGSPPGITGCAPAGAPGTSAGS